MPQLLKKSATSIRELAHVIGLLVSSLPAVQYGPLYYKSLEIDKNTASQQNNGNYEATMTLSLESVRDLSWWVRLASLQRAKMSPWAIQL